MKEETEKILAAKNIRPTSVRILVYEYLSTLSVAVSLPQIEKYLYKADKVTIYRTLQTFQEKGLVHKILDESISKYRLCTLDCTEDGHNDWHLHLYCKQCKQTTCEESMTLPKAEVEFQIDKIQILAKGICAKCLKSGRY